MSEEQIELILLKDDQGGLYMVPKPAIAGFKLPDELAEKLAKEEEVSGYQVFTYHSGAVNGTYNSSTGAVHGSYTGLGSFDGSYVNGQVHGTIHTSFGSFTI